MASGVVKDACFFLSSCAAVPTARMFPELLLAWTREGCHRVQPLRPDVPPAGHGEFFLFTCLFKSQETFFSPQQDSMA